MQNKKHLYRIENEVVSSLGHGISFDFQKLFPQSSVLQLPDFSKRFYSNRKCRFFRLINNEIVVGVCLVSEYFFHAEIQFGPQTIDDSIIEIFIEEICAFYRKKLYGQIKICFPTGLQKDVFESTVDYISEYHSVTKESKGTWNSLIINLEREQIQSGYSENLKRNIKKATQQGLIVRQINSEKDIIQLGEIFDTLYRWRKVKSQWNDSPPTFLAWFESEELKKKTIWFGVYNSKDEMLGGIMLVNQGDTVFYQLGTSDPEHRYLPLLHLCFHKAILYAKENNFSFFDFGGYDIQANKNDQTFNINNFKKQFGGEVVAHFPNIVVTLNKSIKFFTNFLVNLRKSL